MASLQALEGYENIYACTKKIRISMSTYKLVSHVQWKNEISKKPKIHIFNKNWFILRAWGSKCLETLHQINEVLTGQHIKEVTDGRCLTRSQHILMV